MMGEHLVLQHREYLIKDLMPHRVYFEYFDVLAKDKAIYITVVLDEDQRPIVFLEKSNKSTYGICRMFFRKEDAKRYVKTVSAEFKDSMGSVRSWETSFTDLSKFLIRFNNTAKEQGKTGIHVYATVIHKENFCDIDTVWTAAPEFMV